MLWNRLKHGDRLVIRCPCGQEHSIEKRGKALGLIGSGFFEVRRVVKRLTRKRQSAKLPDVGKTKFKNGR